MTARDEARDMWRVHLERGEFSLALEHCAGGSAGTGQRGAVHVRQAEAARAAGDPARAAAFYARAGAAVSLEAVCLEFMERGEDSALVGGGDGRLAHRVSSKEAGGLNSTLEASCLNPVLEGKRA